MFGEFFLGRMVGGVFEGGNSVHPTGKIPVRKKTG